MHYLVSAAIAAAFIAVLAAAAPAETASLDSGVLKARFEDGALVSLALAGGEQIDLLCTWLGSDRPLLCVHIADPTDKMEVAMTIDGKPVEVKKAYSAIYPVSRDRTFTGFYADVSALAPGAKHTVEAALPPLQPGQFQGLFFENVEAEYTTTIAP